MFVNCSKLGLHLCDRCEKDNAEVLKKLLNCCKIEESVSEMTVEIKEVKKILQERTDRKDKLNEQLAEWKLKLDKMRVEFVELNQKFDRFKTTDPEKDKKWISDKFDDLNLRVDSIKAPTTVEKEINKR